MADNANNLIPTVAEIAKHFNVSFWQAQYALQRINAKPIGRAGPANVYAAEDVQRVGNELKQIAERRLASSTSISASA